MKRFQENLAKIGTDPTNNLEMPLAATLIVLVVSVGYSLFSAFRYLA